MQHVQTLHNSTHAYFTCCLRRHHRGTCQPPAKQAAWQAARAPAQHAAVAAVPAASQPRRITAAHAHDTSAASGRVFALCSRARRPRWAAAADSDAQATAVASSRGCLRGAG